MEIPKHLRGRLFESIAWKHYLYFSSTDCYLVPSWDTERLIKVPPDISAVPYLRIKDIGKEFALEILLTHPDQVIRNWVKGELLKRDSY